MGRVLIIAPLRVARDTWTNEIKKWEHLHGLSYSVAIGKESERLAALKKSANIYIINRENVEWLIEKSGVKFNFDMLVIDELSSFKSHQTKRFHTLMKKRPLVKRIVGLTGTPSSNGLIDLWSEFKLLDMGERLGKYVTQYRENFLTPDKRNGQTVFSYKPKAGAKEEIYQRISDITISMTSTDYLKMPSLVENRVEVFMDDREKKIYEKMKQEMIVRLGEKEIDAVNAAALSNKLLQMANGAVYDADRQIVKIHEKKLEALGDLIEGANGKPVLIAYWYKHDLERIKNKFFVREIKSEKEISDWNEGKISVGAIHPASAGHGLNLQSGGSTIIWFGLTWSLELYQQTNARLWRQGQKNTVVIHHILTAGTIDENVMRALSEKNKTQAALIEAVKVNLEGAK